MSVRRRQRRCHFPRRTQIVPDRPDSPERPPKNVQFSRLRNELAPLTQLTLFDVAGSTTLLPELARDSRVRVVEGDLAEPGTASELVCASGDVSIIHLASMVSGNTETDTEEGWRVNVGGHRALLEAVRLNAPGARLVDSHTVH